MAQRMATWDSSSYLKLSAVLEMYYSETGIHGDTKYRACNRLYNYRDPAIVDQAMLKEQVYGEYCRKKKDNLSTGVKIIYSLSTLLW